MQCFIVENDKEGQVIDLLLAAKVPHYRCTLADLAVACVSVPNLIVLQEVEDLLTVTCIVEHK